MKEEPKKNFKITRKTTLSHFLRPMEAKKVGFFQNQIKALVKVYEHNMRIIPKAQAHKESHIRHVLLGMRTRLSEGTGSYADDKWVPCIAVAHLAEKKLVDLTNPDVLLLLQTAEAKFKDDKDHSRRDTELGMTTKEVVGLVIGALVDGVLDPVTEPETKPAPIAAPVSLFQAPNINEDDHVVKLQKRDLKRSEAIWQLTEDITSLKIVGSLVAEAWRKGRKDFVKELRDAHGPAHQTNANDEELLSITLGELCIDAERRRLLKLTIDDLKRRLRPGKRVDSWANGTKPPGAS